MKEGTSPDQVAAFIPLSNPLPHDLTPPRTRSSSLISCNHVRVSRRSALAKFARTLLSIATAVPAVLHARNDAIAAGFCPSAEYIAETIDPATDRQLLITDTVDIYIRAGDSVPEKITLGLFGCVVPRTVENFKRLITQGAYDNTPVYRIVPSLTVQMGETSGTLEEETVQAENYAVLHTVPGIVSMVRDRDGTVDSRFFVATRQGDSQYLDGKYSAFGIVTQGLEKLTSLERFAGRANIPKVPITIERAVVLADTHARKLNDRKTVGTPVILQGETHGNLKI